MKQRSLHTTHCIKGEKIRTCNWRKWLCQPSWKEQPFLPNLLMRGAGSPEEQLSWYWLEVRRGWGAVEPAGCNQPNT